MKLSLNISTFNVLKMSAVISLLSLASVGPVAVVAQQAAAKPAPVAVTPSKVVAEEEEGPAKPQKPGFEGIKMHGHWVIDLKNPDGSLAKHTEFENSLQTTGATALLSLLAGQAVSTSLVISLIDSNGGHTFLLISPTVSTFAGSASDFCSNFGGVSCVKTLTTKVNPPTLDPNTGAVTGPPSMVLSGTGSYLYNPSYGFTISQVATLVSTCQPASGTGFSAVSPATCSVTPYSFDGSTTAATLTSTNLPTPVTLAPGQFVTVTVTLTFS
jgi:hypothetical protein